jgi:hypothetical protein
MHYHQALNLKKSAHRSFFCVIIKNNSHGGNKLARSNYNFNKHQKEILTNSSAASPLQTKLSGFNDYQEFLNFSESLFQLKPKEYHGLFNVLLKLQSIGQDAVQTMLLWNSNTDKHDCYELIRFMIQFDSTDMEDILN